MPSRPTFVYHALRSTRPGSTRTTGLVIAAILGAVSIATVAYFLSTSQNRNTGRSAAPLPNDGVVPPLELIPPGTISAKTGSPTMTGGKGIQAEFASRSDPTKLAGRILSASLDPLEGSRYNAELPQSYLYLKDGRTIYIRSDTAKFLLPQGPSGKPDSGVLDGNVAISIFDRREDGAAIDLAKDTPALKITTSTLTFDITAGQFTGPDRFVVSGPTVDFAGTGLNILYNQKDERLELLTIAKSETLRLRPKTQRIAKGGETTTGANGAVTSAAGTGPASAGQAVAVVPAPPRPQLETFYHAMFNDSVRVRQGDRTIDSDVMELWLRLLDNQLAPNAIAQTKAANRTTVLPPGSEAPSSPSAVALADGKGSDHASKSVAETSVAATNQPAVLATLRDEVVLNWSGPLRVEPLNERPTTLKGNEVAARFSANPGTVVAFKDGGSNADGTSATLDYSATTRDIAMAAPEPRGVHLTLPNSGEVFGQRLAINLGTGVASVTSGGELRGLGKGTGLALAGGSEVVGPPESIEEALVDGTQAVSSDPQTPLLQVENSLKGLVARSASSRSVTWTDQADFLFATANETMTGSLLSATLAGGVRGTDGRSSLESNWLRAEFAAPVAGTRTSSTTVLARLRAQDKVVGTDGQDGKITTDQLDVAFEPRPGSSSISDAVLMTMTGSAVASRKDSTLHADLIEARLKRGPTFQGPGGIGSKTENNSEVSDVLARKNVRFTRTDGVWARGDELRATTATQIADLIGTHAAIGKDQSRVEGSQMRLDGVARALEVFGEGRFRFVGKASDVGASTGNDPSVPRENAPANAGGGWASWTLGMTFDDKAGLVDCRGNVRAEMNPDAASQRTLAGERLHLEITPGGSSSAARVSEAQALASSQNEPRKLLRAAVFGSEDGLDASAVASVQSSTFEPSADASQPRRMIGLQYLEGSIIRVDDVLGTLTVPAAGRMLVADRKPPENLAALDTGALANGAARRSYTTDLNPTTRGDSLFTWQGSLVADRNHNTATFRGGVRITHQQPGSADATELESEEIVANVSDPNERSTLPSDSNSDQLRVRLTRATATGAVWARSAGKELTADLLDYDVAGRVMKASGSDNNDVILFDLAKPTPITAKLLEWDLARDRVEVKRPGTIVVPADLVKSR